jgi:hypothetical protein
MRLKEDLVKYMNWRCYFSRILKQKELLGGFVPWSK